MTDHVVESVNDLSPKLNGRHQEFVLKLWFYVPLVLMATTPLRFTTKVVMFVMAYALDNWIFMSLHLILHKTFERYPKVQDAKRNMSAMTYVAYLHHYVNPRIFSMLKPNLALLYLDNVIFHPNETPRITKFHVMIALMLSCLARQNIIFMTIAGVLNKCKKHSLYFYVVLFTAYANVLAWRIDLTLFACASTAFMLLLQLYSHNWYHTTDKDKRKQWGSIEYMLLQTMDYVGVINTFKHKVHHTHTLKNMHQAEDFADMWVPRPVEWLFDWFWNTFHDRDDFEQLCKYILYTGIVCHLTLLWCFYRQS